MIINNFSLFSKMQWWLDPLVTVSMLLQLLLSWQQSLHLALCIFASTVVHSHEIFSKLYEVSHILAWIFPRIYHQQALLEPRKEKTHLFIVHIIPYSYLSINITLFHFYILYNLSHHDFLNTYYHSCIFIIPICST